MTPEYEVNLFNISITFIISLGISHIVLLLISRNTVSWAIPRANFPHRAISWGVLMFGGLGVLAGLEVINVPGATGFLDTNYLGKAEYGLESLKHKDFLFLHVEATDEAGHMGAADKKVQALEDFDQKVVGTILAGLRDHDEWRILLMPDHATPVAIKTHSDDPVPFAVLSSADLRRGHQKSVQYNEPSAKSTGVVVSEAWRIMERFIRGDAIVG